MLDLAWKSTLLLAVAFAAAFVLRNRSAALRHLVWVSAFGALLLLPVLPLALPALTLPREAPLGGLLATVNAVGSAPAASVTSSPSIGAPAPQPTRALPNISTALGWLWAAGTAFCLLRILIACLGILKLRRRVPRIADTGTEQAADQLRLHRSVETLEIPAGETPSSFGNTVFLPADAAGWSSERRHAVLLHELTHVQRSDTAVQILARIAWSGYWWNPLAWLAWRRLVDERERSVDDAVLQTGIEPADYASHLMELARSMRPAAQMAPVLVAMATTSKLEGRIMAILDSSRDRRVPGKFVALAITAAALAVFVPLAALRAQEPAALPADLDSAIRFRVSNNDAAGLETMARTASAQAENEIAKKLLRVALEVQAKNTGELSKEYGRTLLKLAEMQWRTNDPAAAASFEKAAKLLDSQPDAAQALIAMAVMQINDKTPESAEMLLQRAVTIDPKAAARAKMWIGVIRERQGRSEDANLVYTDGLSLADPGSADAADLMQLHARLLGAQGKIEEAGELGRRALEIRRAQTPLPVTGAGPKSGVYRIGPGIVPPKVVSKVEPQYSPDARAAKYQGTVKLSVEINDRGLAENLQVVSGLGFGLNENAMASIRQWKFEPAKKDGQPVPVAATIEVNFRLL